MVTTTVELIGNVDALVSNAGLSRPWDATSDDPGTFRAIVETNLIGAQQLTSHVVAGMRDAGGGDLVYMSSDVVQGIPRPWMSAYTASKHALEGWVSVLQAELEGTGVRASIIRPGPTQTNHADGWDPDAMTAMFNVWTDRGVVRHWSLLEPWDVAAAVAAVIDAPRHVHLRLIEIMPTVPRAEAVV